jgi:hypothetical protein
MRRPMRPELSAPRTISRPAGAGSATYLPWVEVSALVHLAVSAWGVEDTTWMHWAMPVDDGRPNVERMIGFDPNRRAATPGEPAVSARAGRSDLNPDEVARVCEVLAEVWKPRLHFHAGLRLASGLDEPIEVFRRRCLALLAPVLRNLESPRCKVESARRTSTIESRELGGPELKVLRWRVGVGWYPSGIEPSPAPEDPMMFGYREKGK